MSHSFPICPANIHSISRLSSFHTNSNRKIFALYPTVHHVYHHFFNSQKSKTLRAETTFYLSLYLAQCLPHSRRYCTKGMNEGSLGRRGSHNTQFDYTTINALSKGEKGERANNTPVYINICIA